MSRQFNKDRYIVTTELIKLISKESGVSQANVKKVFKATKRVVLKCLADGFDVKFHNVGVFYIKNSMEKIIYDFKNPGKTKPCVIPKKVMFQVSRDFSRKYIDVLENKASQEEEDE